MENQVEHSDRLLRLPEVQSLTGMGRSMIYGLAQRDAFPRPIKLSERCSVWSEGEVRAWIRDRITEARGDRQAAA